MELDGERSLKWALSAGGDGDGSVAVHPLKTSVCLKFKVKILCIILSQGTHPPAFPILIFGIWPAKLES